ncbi:MAG: hypothetical protein PVG78_10750 [Desulfobacterales bacterium]
MHRIWLVSRRRPRRRWVSPSAAAALAVAICLWMAAAAAGQETLPEILPINPVPGIELVRYDVSGLLSEIREDVVVVGDTAYRLSTSEGVKFFVEGSPAPVYKSFLKEGDLVGCVYDDFSKVKEVWKLKSFPAR